MKESKYYLIGQVSKMLDIPASSLRYWETQFPDVKPLVKNGIRRYTLEDIGKIKSIIKLTREQEYTINGAKNTMKQTAKKNTEIVAQLKYIRQLLMFIRDNL